MPGQPSAGSGGLMDLMNSGMPGGMPPPGGATDLMSMMSEQFHQPPFRRYTITHQNNTHTTFNHHSNITCASLTQYAYVTHTSTMCHVGLYINSHITQTFLCIIQTFIHQSNIAHTSLMHHSNITLTSFKNRYCITQTLLNHHTHITYTLVKHH